MPNLSDVAQATGVSTSTVSRALRMDSRISNETIQRIHDAANALGYVRRAQKETLRPQEWGCVGLIVPEVMSGYYARLAHIAVSFFAKQYYSVTIRLTNFEQDTVFRHVKELCFSNVDCLLIVVDDSEEMSEDIFSTVSKTGKPAFFITAKYMFHNDFDSLFIDEQRGIAMLLEYFADKGYKHIGFVGEQQTLGRRDAYVSAMARLHLPIQEEFVKISPFRAEVGGYHSMREILAAKTRPDAVFLSYDQMAIGAIKAIKEAGLSMPDEIAVAGFDDIIVSEYITGGLTTVQSPCEDMIAIASRVLLNRVNDPHAAPQQIALKPKLIVRGTA